MERYPGDDVKVMHQGIVYIIGGKKYAKLALASVLSLRKNGGRASNSVIQIHFMGKFEFKEQFEKFDCICIKHSSDKTSHSVHRKLKSSIMQNIEFDRYIMIDADTFVQGDFYDMFDLIPENGVASIEDGNFENHLQMAKFLFLTKHADKKNVRNIVKEMLGVDYGLEEKFPPYYNVGVIGFSSYASKIIGRELLPLLEKLSSDNRYNPHDEQLPMNAIMHLNNIQGAIIDPVYNYTRSRMKKNKKLDIHDNIKENIRIIHNRRYENESDWIDFSPIKKELEKLIGNS